LGNIDRRAAAAGNFTGRTADEINYADTLARRGTQDYINNLAPALSGQQTAAGGIQQGFGALGNLFSQGGQQQASVYENLNPASLYSNLGANLSNVYTGTSGKLGDLYAGTGDTLAKLAYQNAVAKGNLGSQRYQDIYGAQKTADMNTLNALFKVGDTAAMAFGMV
jgi:hypothetical protein